MGLEADFDIPMFRQAAKDAIEQGARMRRKAPDQNATKLFIDRTRADVLQRVETAAREGRNSAKVLHLLVKPNFKPDLRESGPRKKMSEEELKSFGLHPEDAYAALRGEEIGHPVCHLFFTACDAAGLHPRAFYRYSSTEHEYVLIANW